MISFWLKYPFWQLAHFFRLLLTWDDEAVQSAITAHAVLMYKRKNRAGFKGHKVV